MELRITSIFRPFTRAVGFFLSEMDVSPTKIAFVSFLAALISGFLFLVSFRVPLISVEAGISLALALIFTNAFFDDVERRLEKRSKKKSLFGGPLGTFLGQKSDAFIIFGVLLFLAGKDTYYDFGEIWLLNLSYVEPGFDGHLALGLSALIGIIILGNISAQKKERGAGLWTRSERMYLISLFGILGFASGLFSGYLFTGIFTLTVLIYASIAKRVLLPKKLAGRSYYKVGRSSKRAIVSTGGFIKGLFKKILRVIGVILLGVYLTLEKLYLQVNRWVDLFFNLFKSVPSIKRAETAPPTTALQKTMENEVEISAAETEAPPSIIPSDDTSYMGGDDVGESMIVEYEPTSKKEETLMDIVDFMISEGKDVVIVSSQPGTGLYSEKFGGVEGIRLINLPEQTTSPTRDEIPMTNLEYFSEVFENLTKDHVFIFEPLSSLILHIGVAQAYRFISKSLERLSALGVTLIVFLNKEGHDKKDVSNFENLFRNIGEIEEGKLKKVR